MKKVLLIISVVIVASLSMYYYYKNDPTFAARKILKKEIEEEEPNSHLKFVSFEKTDAVRFNQIGIEYCRITGKVKAECIWNDARYTYRDGDTVSYEWTIVLEKHEQGWVKFER